MKPDLHPTCGPVVVCDKAAGTAFLSNSTLAARLDLPISEWGDGYTDPVFDVDVSEVSHPFWSGSGCVLDRGTGGEVPPPLRA